MNALCNLPVIYTPVLIYYPNQTINAPEKPRACPSLPVKTVPNFIASGTFSEVLPLLRWRRVILSSDIID